MTCRWAGAGHFFKAIGEPDSMAGFRGCVYRGPELGKYSLLPCMVVVWEVRTSQSIWL